jgi:hypothetical protein
VWWFTLVIAATWEAEIGRIAIQCQLRQKASATQSQSLNLSIVIHHLSYVEGKNWRILVQARLGKNESSYSTTPKAKRVEGMVEHLPIILKLLISNCSTDKTVLIQEKVYLAICTYEYI